jgi:menaquinone-dependent protoporphyrinogen oxidase
MSGLIPIRTLAAKPQFLQTRCTGGDARSPKILIAYASMHGSTGEVADTIANDLCRAGASVDVRLVGRVREIGDYQAVIIGSAIKSDRWLPEAITFVSTNKNVLSNLPTAYFLTCLTLAKSSKASQHLARSFLDSVFDSAPEVNPSCIGLFPGVLDYSKYSKGMGAVMHYKMWTKGIDAGDYRDWSMIHDFSRQFRTQLVGRSLLAEDI